MNTQTPLHRAPTTYALDYDQADDNVTDWSQSSTQWSNDDSIDHNVTNEYSLQIDVSGW